MKKNTYLLLRLLSTLFLPSFILHAADVPPDDMAEALGRMPELWHVRLSPDGNKISYLTMDKQEDFPILVVFDINTGKHRPLLGSVKGKFNLYWCEWTNQERILCGMRGVEKVLGNRFYVTRLVAVNSDGKSEKLLMQLELDDTDIQYMDKVVNLLPGEPEYILVQYPGNYGKGTVNKIDSYFDGYSVVRLNIYTGGHMTREHSRDESFTWLTDNQGNIRSYTHVSKDYRKVYYRRDEKSMWELIDKSDYNTPGGIYPVDINNESGEMLVIRSEEGRHRLRAVDLDDMSKERRIDSHPYVDASRIVRLGKEKRVVGIGHVAERKHYQYLDSHLMTLYDRLFISFKGKTFHFIDESWDKKFYLIYLLDNDYGGDYYYYDVNNGKLTKFLSDYPNRLKPVETRKNNFTSRNGATVNAWLTLPEQNQLARPPVVILSHGGPSSWDFPEITWLVQFLAARGYAVMQIEYRGALSYNRMWEIDSAYGKWQQVIDDLSDGVKYIIKKGLVDPEHVCVMGWSFGGYAALMSGLERGDQYRCIIAIAGVTDVSDLLTDREPFINHFGFDEFVHNYGMSNSSSSNMVSLKSYLFLDENLARRGSPQKRSKDFNLPLLLIHGKNDIFIPFEHSEKLYDLLSKQDKRVDMGFYEHAGHYIESNRARHDMLTKIDDFLGRYLRN